MPRLARTRTPRLRATAIALVAIAGATSTAAQVPGGSLAALLREHKYPEALERADRQMLTAPRDAEVWFYRALAENGLGQQDKALHDLEQALSFDPAMVKAAEAGAQIAYRQHDRRAQSFLQEVLRLEPANTTAHAMLGVLALEQADCGAAVAEFSQAGALAGDDPASAKRVALCRAKLALEAGNPALAEQELVTLSRSAPQDALVATDLAEVLLESKQPARAVALLAPLRDTLPANGLNLLATAYAQADDVSSAIATYRESIRRAPEDESNYLDLAMLSMEHQSPPVALAVLDAGLKQNPRSPRLLVGRGTVYAQVGQTDLAQKDFERADELAPNSTYGALGMGVLLREDGDLDKAEAVLEEKLKATPGSPLLRYMLADVLIRKGATPGTPPFARAVQMLRACVEAEPTLAPAHALLGKLLLKDSRPEEAIQELEAAIRLQPNDRTALNQLVAGYRRLGRTADAERVSAILQSSVASERAQENERNRIHLSLDGVASTSTAASPATPERKESVPGTGRP